MRKLVPAAVTALVLALAPAAAAEPVVPAEDVAHGVHNAEGVCMPFPPGGVVCGKFTIAADAHSGPSGEAPRGTVTFSFLGFTRTGTVTCLRVAGDRAAVEVDEAFFGSTVVHLQDGEVDRFAWTNDLTPGTCTPPQETSTPANGFVEVHDAQPGPTRAADCKKGSWRRYGFRNQGACVSSVRPPATRG